MSLSWGPCLPFPKASCDALRRAFLTMWSVKGGLFIHGSPLFFINGLVFAGALLTYVEGAGGGFIELIEARPRPHSREENILFLAWDGDVVGIALTTSGPVHRAQQPGGGVR